MTTSPTFESAASRTVFSPAFALAAGATLLVLFALTAPRVEAQCAQWDASGKWRMLQGTGVPISMQLSQKGDTVTGTASYFDKYKGTIKGPVGGTIRGNKFVFEIYWDRPVIGTYDGDISPQGNVAGVTFDKQKPSIRAAWQLDSPLKCTQTAQAAPPAPVTPKPIKKVGARLPKQAPAVEPGTTGKPPTAGAASITVNPRVVTIPAGGAEGTATLTWDAGADHPYAELWVQEDGGDEQFVVEKAKGTRSVTVERGKSYLYILSDSGQRLASVTVRAN